MDADSGRKPGWGQPGCDCSINTPFYGPKRQFRNGSMSKAFTALLSFSLTWRMSTPCVCQRPFLFGRGFRRGSCLAAIGRSSRAMQVFSTL